MGMVQDIFEVSRRNLQGRGLAWWKSRNPTFKCSLSDFCLAQSTVYWEDAGSKIHFSLISVYKNWDIRPQGLDLGGSMASNEVNMRPWGQYLLFLMLKLPGFND